MHLGGLTENTRCFMIRIVKSHFVFIWPFSCRDFKLILIRSSYRPIRRRQRTSGSELTRSFYYRANSSLIVLVIKIFPHHRSWFEPRYKRNVPTKLVSEHQCVSIRGARTKTSPEFGSWYWRYGLSATNCPEFGLKHVISNWSSKDASADPWFKIVKK